MHLAGATYEEVYRSFRWEVPARFNIAHLICDRHAATTPDAPALLYEQADGSLRPWSFAEVQAAANRFAGGEWASWTFPRDGWVNAIASGADGRLWVGTSRGGFEPDPSAGGLWVWDRVSWTQVDTSVGLADNDIQAIAADGSQCVGIAQSAQVAHIGGP